MKPWDQARPGDNSDLYALVDAECGGLDNGPMPYVPKSTAPPVFSLDQSFIALITGDSQWGWLTDWAMFLGPSVTVTSEFCAGGPSGAPPLGANDFSTFSRNPILRGLQTVAMVSRIADVAHDRVFGAYCEFAAFTPPVVCSTAGTFHINDHRGGNQNLFAPQRALPAGTTRVQARAISSDSAGWNCAWFFWNGATFLGFGGNTNPAVGATVELTIPFSNATHYQVNYDNNVVHVGDVELLTCSGGALVPAAPYVPTAEPKPTGLPDPTKRVYTDIPSLGAELDRQEMKLDALVSMVTFLANYAPVPAEPDPATPPVDAAAGPADITGAAGVIVTVTSIPASADEDFGTPPVLHRVGHLAIGSNTAWLPAIPISHSPMLVMPLPPGMTRAQATVYPPATATITVIAKPK